ncbi:HNH endonuclease [Duganella radicis]|uniref:HNH endonuclease n=1 Tax=Duganella radicis TaxID=551988 RepID=A0A6L6PEH6_9BURK|nr:HNH endonuclease [Duganella radicis]MTV37017.1 HNH endonuclease [Duganella radicis]
MNPLQRALIEKLGHDYGFEHVLASDAGCVVLASARHPANARVTVPPSGGYLLYLLADTPALLPEMNRTFGQESTAAGFVAKSEARLAAFLRRAAGLARALPSQAAQDYEASVATQLAQLPTGVKGTEVERLVRQRVGQQKFREAMLDYWGGACAVTGLALPEVLRASHAKPWSECESDAERLDVFNGFLLVANLDALFDRFLISFDDGGHILVSSRVGHVEQTRLGLVAGMTLRWLTDPHRNYLALHRARCGDLKPIA